MKSLITKLNLNKRKIVFWILTLICMIIIFCFSAKNADDSTKESHRVGKTVGYIVEYDFQDWTPDAQERYAEKIDHPVRKTAHFMEYMLLGSLATYAWYDEKYRKWIRLAVPFAIGAVYSMTDELHQMLVSGRAGMITDVLLDSSGVLTGVLLSSLVLLAIRKYMEG